MAVSERLVSTLGPRTVRRPPCPVTSRNGLRQDAFRDAMVAMCALVATVDGRIDPALRMRILQLGGSDVALYGFSAAELRNLFEDNCARLIMDPGFGHAYVMQRIAAATGHPEEARVVLRIGLYITDTGAERSAHAGTALAEACRVLHLDPREFGLPA